MTLSGNAKDRGVDSARPKAASARRGPTRRPVDRVRMILALAGLVLVIGLAVLQRAVPDLLLAPIVFAAGVVMAAVPAFVAVERLFRGEARLVTNGVLAALIAYLVALGLNLYVLGPGPDVVQRALAQRPGGGGNIAPLHLYIATVVAFITVVGFADRYLLRNAAWGGLVVTALAALVGNTATLPGMLLTFLLGRLVAFAVRWLRGTTDPSPTDADVAAALAETDLPPVTSRRIANARDGTRRYEAFTDTDERFTVTVLDRDRITAGLAYRLYQRLRLRRPAQSQGLMSLQHLVEQRTLLALAVRHSGIRTPRLAAVRKLNADAVLFAYEDVPGRTLDRLAPEELTDDLLTKVWQVAEDLHQHQISHRRMSADAFIVGDDGKVWLTRLEAGGVAAAALQHRLDDAELLVTLGLLTDPERAVRTARTVLGDATLGAVLPLLRPAGLSLTTRSRLRRDKGVLEQVGKEILAFQPEAPAAKAVVYERLQPRTILSALGGCVAVYFLIGQFASQPIGEVFKGISWPWALLALAGAAVTYLAAAMNLAGFVPMRLNYVRLLLAQLAASFVTLVTPAAVGGLAVNTRFLQKAGVASGLAVTCMAASQIAMFGAFLLLVMLFGSLSGSSTGSQLPPSSVIVTVLLAVALIAVVVATVPRLRKFTLDRVKPYFSDVGPRMLELARDPARLAFGVGGAFLLPLAGSLALWASVLAFEDDKPVQFATVAVVFLIGKTAGSLVPTPGGLGAVEAVLSGGLAAATGISGSTAFSAVILFRLLTFWLPIAPGWVATTWLQKREAL
ncbi:lysylphosphatidylglycerol synthase transmembrane domain-containing protein [Streptomyces mesophilus]|uniref:lysylphosphatidylglycerol synthase transmembrane domain-containing protein n=1 Tax=Streptomyces mesophilus TaxID=1775132 RepID=UPI00332483C1